MLYDKQKHQDITVFLETLTKQKLSLEDLKSAIWSLDESVISIDTLQTLKNIMPSFEEMKDVKKYRGWGNDLDKPSQFCRAINDIHKPRERVEIWLMIRTVRFQQKNINCIFLISKKMLLACCDEIRIRTWKKFSKLVFVFLLKKWWINF